MPSARRAGVPPDVLKEWEADFRQKKADQQKAGGKKLPSGSAQYTYNGVTYTAKYVGKNRAVNFPEAAYEARVESGRSRKGEQQKIQLSSMEQLMRDYRYEDARMLSEYLGQDIEVDHTNPVSKGGFSNDPNNLGLLSKQSNLGKSNLVGGDAYRQAIEEGRYLSELANRLREERGGIHFNPFMTGVTLPPLPGFQQDTPQPTVLPGGTTYKPPELKGMATDQKPMQLPPQPQEDLSQQVMQAAGMVLTVGAGLVQGAGGVINFVTGGGF